MQQWNLCSCSKSVKESISQSEIGKLYTCTTTTWGSFTNSRMIRNTTGMEWSYTVVWVIISKHNMNLLNINECWNTSLNM